MKGLGIDISGTAIEQARRFLHMQARIELMKMEIL